MEVLRNSYVVPSSSLFLHLLPFWDILVGWHVGAEAPDRDAMNGGQRVSDVTNGAFTCELAGRVGFLLFSQR